MMQIPFLEHRTIVSIQEYIHQYRSLKCKLKTALVNKIKSQIFKLISHIIKRNDMNKLLYKENLKEKGTGVGSIVDI